jgi:hypothetical protein
VAQAGALLTCFDGAQRSHEGAQYQIQGPADFVQLDRSLSAQGEISKTGRLLESTR